MTDFDALIECGPRLATQEEDVDPFAILARHMPPGSLGHRLLIPHAVLVAQKALIIARRAGLMHQSIEFIEQAALLHDIGTAYVAAPEMGCLGDAPYICHGVIGRQILEREGLSCHARVAETHVGVGLTREDIIRFHLPLPERDMAPRTLEEEIIAYADLFFSKNPEKLWRELQLHEIRAALARHGARHVKVFDSWLERFGP